MYLTVHRTVRCRLRVGCERVSSQQSAVSSQQSAVSSQQERTSTCLLYVFSVGIVSDNKCLSLAPTTTYRIHISLLRIVDEALPAVARRGVVGVVGVGEKGRGGYVNLKH
ncbi:hypothetical protein RR48_03004 [Papilio machaon]|uniref:Uncharacterized protein n=1 Tax=Papilio machaon TaxID=76193 RepID=A0A0N1I897_PAPMA|nr:hypothetical protein RR48_03004 [Papilio machaon]